MSKIGFHVAYHSREEQDQFSISFWHTVPTGHITNTAWLSKAEFETFMNDIGHVWEESNGQTGENAKLNGGAEGESKTESESSPVREGGSTASSDAALGESDI